VRCEAAERELSARLDDAPDSRLDGPLAEHLATCSRCRSFEAGARRVREATRVRPADPVPDLVPRIMAEVRREAARRPSGVLRRLAPRTSTDWRGAAASFAAGAVAAALVVGGLPGLRRGPESALATEIPREIAEASAEVTEYRARFDLVEQNFHPRVPVRTFTVAVTFVAPERFRARVTDLTDYPSPEWPRNDALLAVDRDRWFRQGPVTCPREALPACATGGREEIAVRGREPFDGDALLPTDIILPVRTLVGTGRVRPIGERKVLGRDAVTLELAYRDAVALFAALQAGGSWRPFFPHDRVLVTLDSESWFPLATEVFPAPTRERREWASRNGLPEEPTDEPIFRAEVRTFQAAAPAGWRPLPGSGQPAGDEGFKDVPLARLRRSGRAPVVPSFLAGLAPYRSGVFAGGGRPADEILLSYTRGLSWLKLRQTRSWQGPQLYGDVGDLAGAVRLDGGGVAYYEPATARLGRRLSIHATGIDLYLETNLSREDLLRVASSLPVRGLPAPEAWLIRRWPGGSMRLHVTLERARQAFPELLLPERLPPGYRLWTLHVLRAEGGTGVTAFFRRPGAELDGVGIRLHQAAGSTLAPPLERGALRVRIRGVTGRYSPERGELEWVEGGVYRSLGGTALDLAGLIKVAESLEEAR
jgi:hypothetical protein